jgi:hypothetical protein
MGIISPISVSDISLQNELLLIKLEGNYSHVTVLYKLKNNGEARSVKYGFPVDWDFSDFMGNEDDDQDYSSRLPQFSIYDGDRFLPFEEKTDAGYLCEKILHGNWNNDETRNDSIKLVRKWQITELKFSKGESKEITVNYIVKNNFLDWATSKSCFVNYSTRTFIYDFTPASKWGNGKAGELKVIIDAADMVNNYDTCIVKGIEGIKNMGNKYIYESNDADLAKLNNFRIEYTYNVTGRSKEIEEQLLNRNFHISLNASSVLPEGKKGINYSERCLSDFNFSTAWAEGEKGNGINQYIDIIPVKACFIGGIAFINGYTKDESAYYNNNRIKTLRITVYNDENKVDTSLSKVVTLEDKSYYQINRDNFAKMLTIVDDYGDGFQLIKKIRLTIEDVYPGRKYNDTCISELFILGHNSEE